MTFGKIKSIIEKNLLESYKDEKQFKKYLKHFKQNVLNNKSISRAYILYDQLSTPQGLSESEAKEFLEEGINLLDKIFPSIKSHKNLNDNIENKYLDIDRLVFDELDINERIKSKKNIISVLTSKSKIVKEHINIPIKSMVNIANQTLKTYINNLDESTQKEFIQIVSEDYKKLENKFETLKEGILNKLEKALKQEEDTDLKQKVSETIDKVKHEKFDHINFLKLKNLEESI